MSKGCVDENLHRCGSEYADVLRPENTVTWNYCPYCGAELDSEFHSADVNIHEEQNDEL